MTRGESVGMAGRCGGTGGSSDGKRSAARKSSDGIVSAASFGGRDVESGIVSFGKCCAPFV